MTDQSPQTQGVAASPLSAEEEEALRVRIGAYRHERLPFISSTLDTVARLLATLDAVRAADIRAALDGLPRIRLSGHNLDTADLPVPDSIFVDWDEHEDFVPLSAVRAALATAAPSEPVSGERLDAFMRGAAAGAKMARPATVADDGPVAAAAWQPPFAVSPDDDTTPLAAPGDAAPEAGERPDLPVGAYVASALEAAKIPCDSGEDVDRFLDELAKRGVVVSRPAPSTEPRDALAGASDEAEGVAGAFDVERLARALCASNIGHYRGWDADLSHATVAQDHAEEAQAVAAEYARLAAAGDDRERGS